MARSIRRTKIFGNCAASEKDDKRMCNRVMRRVVRNCVRTMADFDDGVFPVAAEIMDVWSMAKDGKRYNATAPAAAMRK